MKPEIIIQRPFEITDIGYYRIKYELAGMEHIDQNTCIEQNVMNIDDIYDFASVQFH